MLTVSIHLRHAYNTTNVRAEAVAMGLEKAGCKIIVLDRATAPAPNADLVIQTGFGKTGGLVGALERGLPYVIVEAPYFRIGTDVATHSSWGYGGLAGGAYCPQAPAKERPKPDLHPMKTKGKTYIVGQKLTDHSLRGTDHNKWLEEQFDKYPDAYFRPHPLSFAGPAQAPIEYTLQKAGKIITFSSTVGAEAVVYGCQVVADHWGSIAHNVQDREQWLHELSWKHGSHEWLASRECGKHILTGYEEARSRASLGQQEWPRERIPGVGPCTYTERLLGMPR